MVTVTVHLFAGAAELAGGGQLAVDVPSDTTLAKVAEAVTLARPQLAALVSVSRWAVDRQFMPLSTPIAPQQEIAMIPPVSGG